jgi:hypothetical protein
MVETEIKVVENGTGHWNSEVKFVHCGSVGRENGNHVAFFDTDG